MRKHLEKGSGKILALIQDQPAISAPELAEQLGISARAVKNTSPTSKPLANYAGLAAQKVGIGN